MQKFIIIFIFLLSFPLYSQEKKLVYKEESLVFVINDLEEKFSVRFSFKSELLEGKTITFSGEVSLETILAVIENQALLKATKVSDSDIILKNDEDRIFLEQAFNLDEVLLNAEYLTVGFDKNKDDGSIQISPSKLGILPGLTEPDVLQSLQMLPGISSPTESASDIYIRGGTPDQNLVLWDGIKMYHQGHFFGQISAFNPYITETINVFKAGTSARYGDRISGVIDIRSSEEIYDSLEIGLGANLIQTDAFIKAPLIKNKLSLTASARRSFSDIVNTFTFNKMSGKVFQNTKIDNGSGIENAQAEFEELENRFYFTDYNTKLLWKPNEKHHLSFSSLWVTNKLDFRSKQITRYDSSDIDPTILTTEDILNLNNRGFNFKWNATLSKNLKLKTSAYFSKYNSLYDYQDSYGPDDLLVSFTENLVKDEGGTINFEFAKSKRHVFRLGYDIVSNSVFHQINSVLNSEEIFDEKDDDKLNIHSVFSEYVYLQNKWTLQAGLRHSWVTTVKERFFEPRLFVKHKLNNYWSIKSSYEIKNQAVSKILTTTQNDLGLGNSIWVLSDQNRPILNNKQFSLGLFHEKKDWKIDIEMYYKKIKGLTAIKSFFTTTGYGGSLVDSSNYNFGKSESFGVDILVKKQIKDFRTWLSYSLSKTNYFFNEFNNNKAFLGNFDQTHVLSLSSSYTYKKFQFSLGWNIATGKPYSKAIGVVTNPDTFNEELEFDGQNNYRLKTYHKLDASLLYNFFLNKNKNVKAKTGFSIINIYDRKNELDKNYRIDNSFDPITGTYNNRILEQTTIGLGITPNLLFRVQF